MQRIRLTIDKKEFNLIFGLFLLWIIVMKQYWLPEWHKIESNIISYHSKVEQIKFEKEYISKYKQYTNQNKSIKLKLNTLSQKFTTGIPNELLLVRLENNSKELLFLEIKPSPIKNNLATKCIPIKLKVQGSYLKIMKYIQELEKNSNLIIVNPTFEIEPPDIATAEFTVEFYISNKQKGKENEFIDLQLEKNLLKSQELPQVKAEKNQEKTVKTLDGIEQKKTKTVGSDQKKNENFYDDNYKFPIR
ncbi:hypothetical protein RDV78_06120 [Bacillota bacterium LX-D]|nr:hypothetical protein [Bacillota bacterium LX-D]